MGDFKDVWRRIQRQAGETFHTITGLPFTYTVLGDYLRVARDGEEINRSFSKTNFRQAAEMMPTDGPGGLRGRQGAPYTWAILADARVRA